MKTTALGKPRHVSVAEAAAWLGVSKWRMYQLLNEQYIASVYDRSKRLVIVKSLEAYADSLPIEREVS